MEIVNKGFDANNSNGETNGIRRPMEGGALSGKLSKIVAECDERIHPDGRRTASYFIGWGGSDGVLLQGDEMTRAELQALYEVIGRALAAFPISEPHPKRYGECIVRTTDITLNGCEVEYALYCNGGDMIPLTAAQLASVGKCLEHVI